MKRYFLALVVFLPMMNLVGCKKKGYLYTMKVLHENTQPAAGFTIEAWVKGKSDPQSKQTGPDGIAVFDNLPFPETTSQLVGVVRYNTGKNDSSRKITYPYIDSDAERLKDTQYIPNTATPTQS